MKNLYFVAAALAAFAFTACSDDDTKSEGACYFPSVGEVADLCIQGEDISSKSDCTEWLNTIKEDGGSAIYSSTNYKDSCPSEPDLSCSVKDGKKEVGSLYGYGSMFSSGTFKCEDFGAERKK